MSSFTINVQTSEDSSVLSAEVSSSRLDPSARVANAMKHVKAVIGGSNKGSIALFSSSSNLAAASGTLTLVSAVATDAVTIGAVTLTASSTPANENQWEIDGASDALDATSLAAAINAHSVLSKVVVASANSNVVTITCHMKGVMGNQIPLSSADATITASAAFLAGGTGGPSAAAVTFSNS